MEQTTPVLFLVFLGHRELYLGGGTPPCSMTRKHYKCIIALIALYLVTMHVYNTTNVLNDEENVKEKTIEKKKIFDSILQNS